MSPFVYAALLALTIGVLVTEIWAPPLSKCDLWVC